MKCSCLQSPSIEDSGGEKNVNQFTRGSRICIGITITLNRANAPPTDRDKVLKISYSSFSFFPLRVLFPCRVFVRLLLQLIIYEAEPSPCNHGTRLATTRYSSLVCIFDSKLFFYLIRVNMLCASTGGYWTDIDRTLAPSIPFPTDFLHFIWCSGYMVQELRRDRWTILHSC